MRSAPRRTGISRTTGRKRASSLSPEPETEGGDRGNEEEEDGRHSRMSSSSYSVPSSLTRMAGTSICDSPPAAATWAARQRSSMWQVAVGPNHSPARGVDGEGGDGTDEDNDEEAAAVEERVEDDEYGAPSSE